MTITALSALSLSLTVELAYSSSLSDKLPLMLVSYFPRPLSPFLLCVWNACVCGGKGVGVGLCMCVCV
jgi:hypothetical protein